MIDDGRAGASGPPGTMFTTPLGTPARSQISANRMAVSGVNSAGFSTTVQPAAKAGAIFQASISSGKFHGMICPTTPTALWPANSVSSACAQPAWWMKWRIAKRNVDVAAFADRLAIVE
jgi:hypothetical protein